MVKIKICGLFRDEDIDFANEAGPDYIGFVFAPSRRRVSPSKAARLRRRLRREILPIGVFVNAPIDEIISLYDEGTIAAAQLHGNEDGAYIAALKERRALPVIRALRLETGEGEAPWLREILSRREREETPETPDFFLLDHGAGGAGRTFDWGLLKNIPSPEIFRCFCFLAGGVALHNMEEALSYGPYGIDVSSGAETGGIKDRDKMIRLVQQVRGDRSDGV